MKNTFFALLILGMAFMGIGFVMVKDAVSNYSPFVFLFYRFLTATVVLSVIFYRHLLKATFETAKVAFVCGIPLLTSIFFQTVGLKYTSVSNSAFITGMVVLLIPLFKLLFYKKKVKTVVWISCLIASCGLYIITLKNGLTLNIGDLWTFICAITLAFYVLQSGRFAHTSNPMGRVTIIFAICTLGCALGGAVTPGIDWLPKDYSFWKGILFTAIFGTVYMYAVQNYGQRYIEEEKVALAYLTEPIFATTAAVFLINEQITVETFYGGSLILLGMFLSEISPDKLRRLVIRTQ